MASGALMWLPVASAQAQWSATVLHPQGAYRSEVWGLAAGQQAGTVQITELASTENAALWSGSSGGWSSLGQGFATSYALNGANQVGEFNGRASLWSGTPGSRVELFSGPSVAYSIAGDQQTGYIYQGGGYKAALWTGTAASYVDLHPAGATQSIAYATDGMRQWGFVTKPTPEGLRSSAGYWTGTASSFVSVNPSPAWNSAIQGVGGGQQVGYVTSTQPTLPGMWASLWNGTPESWLDIHPFPGFGSSQLFSTTGSIQVGWSHVPGFSSPKAGAWFGTAQSFVDLTQFLPAGFGGESIATSVFEHNGITYIGGFADGPTGEHQAILWTYVPAPSAVGLIAAAGLLTMRRRHR